MEFRAPSRRELLQLAGLGAGRAMLGCGDNDPFRAPKDHHAAAIFEPTTDAFLVSIWAPLAHVVSVEVRSGEIVVLERALEIDAATGQAVIDVTGLEASTLYEVTIATDDAVRLGPLRVQTAPHDDDPRAVRLAVSADFDPLPQFDTALLAQLSAAQPELYVSIGDFPYTDNGPPATTVDAYRERHAALRTKSNVRALLDGVGVRAIYDDHEFRNDWDAHFVAAEPDRYAAAMQVWDEFFPLRDGVGDVRYRSWRWGAHVECFLLDCRRYRSADAAPDDPTKTMLGATQLAWLVDGVQRSTATFKLVFTSIPLDFGTGDDTWASFQTERQHLFDALVGTTGLLFVSADQHFFASHEHAYGIREFQVGPLARGLGTPGPVVPGVLYRSVQYNFGVIDVDGDALTFSGVGADGEVFHAETLTPAMLQPRKRQARPRNDPSGTNP